MELLRSEGDEAEGDAEVVVVDVRGVMPMGIGSTTLAAACEDRVSSSSSRYRGQAWTRDARELASFAGCRRGSSGNSSGGSVGYRDGEREGGGRWY